MTIIVASSMLVIDLIYISATIHVAIPTAVFVHVFVALVPTQNESVAVYHVCVIALRVACAIVLSRHYR